MTAARTGTGEVLLAGGPVESLDAYLARDGRQGLRNGLALGPAGIIAEVPRSCLRGRGGAGFPQAPNGRAWRAIRARRNMLCATGPRVNHERSRTGIC
jgi:NADH:ubiquinone oxidoreductase subunit F (NADH-binding)